MCKNIKEGLENKMREALRKLRENNDQRKNKENLRNKLFNKLLTSNYGNSLKNCYDALKNNKKNA
jgi:hypothetical protein